jgi:hypothetical protein
VSVELAPAGAAAGIRGAGAFPIPLPATAQVSAIRITATRAALEDDPRRDQFPPGRERSERRQLIAGVPVVPWRGFMSIIAKPGIGKVTLLSSSCNSSSVPPGRFFFSDTAQPRGFTRSLLHDLGAEDHDGGIAGIHWQLNNGSKRT